MRERAKAVWVFAPVAVKNLLATIVSCYENLFIMCDGNLHGVGVNPMTNRIYLSRRRSAAISVILKSRRLILMWIKSEEFSEENPTERTWLPTANAMSVARSYHHEALLLDGRVLIAEGHGGQGEQIDFLTTAELY